MSKKNNNNKINKTEDDVSLSESFEKTWIKFITFLEPELQKLELPPAYYHHFDHIKKLDIAFIMTEMARQLPKYQEELKEKNTVFFINLIKATVNLELEAVKIDQKVIDKAYEFFEVFTMILMMIGQAAQQDLKK